MECLLVSKTNWYGRGSTSNMRFHTNRGLSVVERVPSKANAGSKFSTLIAEEPAAGPRILPEYRATRSASLMARRLRVAGRLSGTVEVS